MDDYKKNIFFFWDEHTPEIYKNNVENYRIFWKDYNIHLITDEFVNEYYQTHDVDFLNIYNSISIGKSKADLIKLLLMYEYGGLYLDIMNFPHVSFTNMDELFKKLEYKQVYVSALKPNRISLQALLAKPKSKLMFELYNQCKKNLIKQYTEEIINKKTNPYNLVVLTGSLLFHDVTVKKIFSQWDTYLKCEPNAEENKQYFEVWDCELINIEEYFYLWYTGIDNHHGKNMHKHWSELQKKQNLFNN